MHAVETDPMIFATLRPFLVVDYIEGTVTGLLVSEYLQCVLLAIYTSFARSTLFVCVKARLVPGLSDGHIGLDAV